MPLRRTDPHISRRFVELYYANHVPSTKSECGPEVDPIQILERSEIHAEMVIGSAFNYKDDLW